MFTSTAKSLIISRQGQRVPTSVLFADRAAQEAPSTIRFFGALQKLRLPGGGAQAAMTSEPGETSGAEATGTAAATRGSLGLKWVNARLAGSGRPSLQLGRPSPQLEEGDPQASTSGEAPPDTPQGWKPFNWLRLGDRQQSTGSVIQAVRFADADMPGDVELGNPEPWDERPKEITALGELR